MPNRTIYVTRYNDDRLEDEKNVSGLINMLLTNHYASKARVMSTGMGASDEKMERLEQLKKQFSTGNYKIPLEQALPTPATTAEALPNEQTIEPAEETA